MARITKRIVIHAPIATIKPFFEQPERWPDWYLALSAPTRLEGKGEEGTYSEHTYQLAGHAYPILHTVAEVKIDDVSAHWKGTFEGSFKGWHKWTYAPVDGDTEVTVEHEYTLPGKMLGRIVDALVVERMIARNLEGSLENLKMLCEERVPVA
jgi:coenzyme Q-binding protein COQ10